jgi:DNA-binding CsgD family transcriptional regulator/tetratricopeptide (TPR) repeat protein
MKPAEETGEARLEADRISRRPALLEREAELAAIEALIDETPDGLGGLLAIEGPPGIGKTSLLREARTLAREAGLQVLAARGSELESTFSFGVVRQLFEPYLAQLPGGDRAELLAGVAEFATPLFEPAVLAAGPPPDASFAMLHGLYWLSVNVAAHRPLLVAIDDLHWTDQPSLRWLLYLLPRLDGLDLSVVVALRPAEPGADPALLGQVVADPAATVVRPAPLSPTAAALLAREQLSPAADEAFCALLHEITGGNPLFVREVLNASAAEDVGPVAANLPRLRELASRAGWRAVSVRLSRLPPAATRLAQAVAILGDRVDRYQAASLAELDEEAASAATADLARVDILRPQPPLRFVHPLVRRAVYDGLSPLERDSGHARASHLLAESGAEPERVAAHLLLVPPALVPPEADAWVVAVLREAAVRARCRGAADGAIAYLRRALAEPPDSSRADLLVELGTAEALLDGEAGIEHLEEAHQLFEDPVLKARAAFLLGRLLFFLRPAESSAVFRSALEDLGGVDRQLESILEAGLLSHALFEPQLYPEAQRRLERIREAPEDAAVSAKWLLALLACLDARANIPASRVVPLARRALVDKPLLPGEVALSPSSGPAMVACNVLVMADLDEALGCYDAAIVDANRNGSTPDLGLAKMHRAQTLVHRGDLAEAEADAREARDAFEEWGTSARLSAWTAAFLADALMEQGRLDDAAAALARVGPTESLWESALPHFFYFSRARLRLLRGDLSGGLDEMLQAGRRFEAIGGRNPAWMPWRSAAALACLELGDRREARRLAAEELDLARTWGAPRALGAALRAVGLAEGGVAGIALLEEAVAVLTESPAKLEHAKARTELGAALRRGNRRAKAREHLRRAVELATICGAAPLAARAETELLATGARPRRVALSGLESLTPSERRVAEMAAEGPTNRQIAQALFVSTKTVEVHLSSVYRKLEISSRSQLPAALAAPARA